MNQNETGVGYSAVVLDIEGTTTPVSFVYDVLFPFARANVAEFLEKNWEYEAVQAAVAQIARDVAADVAAGVEGAQSVDIQSPKSVVESVLWQMDADRKATGLKDLQGQIWLEGYVHGELEAIVYEDVPVALKEWRTDDVPVYIYSSGSIAAQKLLFAYTGYGSLKGYLAGYFDTTTGPKRVAQSYRDIASAIGKAPEQVVFVTDIYEEAVAAREAGLQAKIIVRAGNKELPASHDFAVISSFDELF